jgi:chromate reductase
MNTIHLVGISGSLRTGSHNTALLRAAFTGLPDGVTGRIVPLSEIPVLNEDRKEHPDVVGPVRELRDAVAAADGVVFASPEYNWSVTGALKNAIDWLSIGPDSPLNAKPAAIVGIGGGSGTGRSQSHLRDILAHNGLRIVANPQVMVAGAEGRFDGTDLVDGGVIEDLHAMVGRLVEVIEHARRSEPVEIAGSVLVVGSAERRTGEAVRSITEVGYRTLTAHTAADALDVAKHRRIAVVVIDTAADPETRRAIDAIDDGVPRIVFDDPGAVGWDVDAAVRDRDGTD